MNKELNRLANELDDGTWLDAQGTIWKMGKTVPITVTQSDDMAFLLLHDGIETTPVIYKTSCYVCEDPEFAQMGLPLCRKCPACGGHIAADDSVCDVCGLDDNSFYQAENEKDLELCFCTGYPDYEKRYPTEKQLNATIKAYQNR